MQSRSENPIKEEDLRACRVWIKNFLARTIGNVGILKKILGDLHGISRICTHFLGSIKADNRSDRQQIGHTLLSDKSFFYHICGTHAIMCCNFEIAHITGSVNIAADFLSQLELKVTEKIRLKIREDVQTTPIETTTSSSDVADEEQFFFGQANGGNEAQEQTLERKKQSQEKATE